MLHLDLLRHNKIVDPFFGDNYKKLDWVSNCNITYLFNFTLEPNAHNVDIVFEGVDTYGVVKVNGVELMQMNNSFVEYRVKVGKELIK